MSFTTTYQVIGTAKMDIHSKKTDEDITALYNPILQCQDCKTMFADILTVTSIFKDDNEIQADYCPSCGLPFD